MSSHPRGRGLAPRAARRLSCLNGSQASKDALCAGYRAFFKLALFGRRQQRSRRGLTSRRPWWLASWRRKPYTKVWVLCITIARFRRRPPNACSRPTCATDHGAATGFSQSGRPNMCLSRTSIERHDSSRRSTGERLALHRPCCDRVSMMIASCEGKSGEGPFRRCCR